MVVTNQFNLIDMKKIIFLMIALLTVTAMVAQTRRSNTSRTSGSVRKTTRTTADVGKKTQGTRTTASPSVIFSLPDDSNTEEDYISAMNTQLYRMKKYIELPSVYQFQNDSKSITYKLVYAIQDKEGIKVRMMCRSNMDIISYISSITVSIEGKEIYGKRINQVYNTGHDHKIKGNYYVDDFSFKTNKLIDTIERLEVGCIDNNSKGDVFYTQSFSGIEVRQSEGTDFLYPVDGKNLECLKTDNKDLLSNMGFENHPKEFDLDGLKIKVERALSFRGQIRMTVNFTNNTDRKRRIIFNWNKGMPFVLTATGRILQGNPEGKLDGDDITFDIEGGSNRKGSITFEGDDENTCFLQLLHFYDTQTNRCVVINDIPVEELPKPHGELRFGMTWGQAKNLGYVTEGCGGDCTYSVYEDVDFNSCKLGFPDSNEGKLQNVYFVSDDGSAKSKYIKMSNILKKKYIQRELDKSKFNYGFDEHPLFFTTTNRDYSLTLNLKEPSFGTTRVTLEIRKIK